MTVVNSPNPITLISMEPYIINYNNSKRTRNLLWFLLAIVLFSAGFYYLAFKSYYIYPYFIAICGFGVVFTIIGMVSQIRQILSKDKTAIVLSKEGISSTQNKNSRKIGLVEWADVNNVAVGNTYGVSGVSVYVADRDKYLSRLVSGAGTVQLASEGVALNLSAKETDMSTEDLYLLVKKYKEDYGETTTRSLDMAQ